MQNVYGSFTVELIGYKNSPTLTSMTWTTNLAAANREALAMMGLGWHIAMVYPTPDGPLQKRVVHPPQGK